MRIYYRAFAVGDRPYCLWGPNIEEENRNFIQNIDHEYYMYLARTHSGELKGEDKHRAAMALRTGYHHGLETLLTFLCATLQAPHSIVAWVPNCSTSQLVHLVAGLRDHFNKPPMPNPYGIQRPSFNAIAKEIFQHSIMPDEAKENAIRNFGQAWRRFAKEYLDTTRTLEYNSIKHGF